MSSLLSPKSKLLLLLIMWWKAYRLAMLVGNCVGYQHRGANWWAAPLYPMQRNRTELNNWQDCLASKYTSNFNLDTLKEDLEPPAAHVVAKLDRTVEPGVRVRPQRLNCSPRHGKCNYGPVLSIYWSVSGLQAVVRRLRTTLETFSWILPNWM